MTSLADGGVSVDLPAGWDGQIRGADPDRRSLVPMGTDAEANSSGVVLHAASFPLPAERGDYGSGAVEQMGGSDVLICLLEHEPEAAATALFRSVGVPRLADDMFSPHSMQRAIAGMAGAQRFFQVDGRPFCLYVVVGSHRTRGPLVRTADRVVQSIDIAT